jgi:NAD(P)-dependent dehydrogenase (short-subunit alcohol dehydrogenase family)
VKHLASNPSNTVIGLVRSKAATDDRIAKEGLTGKIHILEADIVDVEALKTAAEETKKILGGSLDVLINNAAYVSKSSQFTTIQEAFVPPVPLQKPLHSQH